MYKLGEGDKRRRPTFYLFIGPWGTGMNGVLGVQLDGWMGWIWVEVS